MYVHIHIYIYIIIIFLTPKLQLSGPLDGVQIWMDRRLPNLTIVRQGEEETKLYFQCCKHSWYNSDGDNVIPMLSVRSLW